MKCLNHIFGSTMMRIIGEMIQGSEDWLTWRQSHLTATAAPIITRLNPWTTRLDLWQEKTLGWSKTPSQKEIARMEAGTLMEPVARQAFIEHSGIYVIPIVAEHDQYTFLGASFDGLSECLKIGVEIKCGQKSFALAKEGIIPDYYLCQMMHQMLIADLDSIYYFCFDGVDSICLLVRREQEFIDKMLEEEIKFWQCVQSFIPPED